MDAPRQPGRGSRRRRSPARSAVAAMERAAVDRYRRGGPRVEGRRLTIVADVADASAARAALGAGADAVRLPLGGGESAAVETDVLRGLVGYGHRLGRRIWARVDGPVPQRRFAAAAAALWVARLAGVEAVAVDDPGLLRLAHDVMPDVTLHAGPGLGVRSAAAVDELVDVGVVRVALAPETTFDEAREIATRVVPALELSLPGAACAALAGRCGLAPAPDGGRCDGPCPAAAAVAGHAERDGGPPDGPFERWLRHVPALQAAGLAAVRVPPLPCERLTAAVHALRRAVDAGPLLDDERLAEVDAILRGDVPAPPPPTAAERPIGLAVGLVAHVDADRVHVVVRKDERPLAEVRWTIAAVDEPPRDLDGAVRPPDEGAFHVETVTVRGRSDAAVPVPAAEIARLWRSAA